MAGSDHETSASRRQLISDEDLEAHLLITDTIHPALGKLTLGQLREVEAVIVNLLTPEEGTQIHG
jgi:hypothetical protein